MNPRIKLVIALLAGVIAAILARVLGYTDLLVSMATVVTVAVLFFGGFWWTGKPKGK